MGNMLMNKRVEESIVGQETKPTSKQSSEYRIFPDHMYGGPQKLGDPNFRGLTKMEEDPLIPQRMRDIARTTFCDDFSEAVNKCGSEARFLAFMYCRPETNKLLECMEAAMNDEDFKKKVTLEYLNERSHYRATGLKTIRYAHGKFVRRDEDLDGPALDKNNQYRPQKPTGWDEAYPDGPPSWANYNYK